MTADKDSESSPGASASEANVAPRQNNPPPSERRAPLSHTLTSRQRACLILVAQGKTDREAGQALKISQHTVRKHIEAARRQFDARTRAQLVVRAIWEDQVSFAQIVGETTTPSG